VTDARTRFALSEQQRIDWLRLVRTESIGPRTFRALLNRHGSARAVIEAFPDLARRAGRPIRLASEAEVERELAALARAGARLIALGEPLYPPLLEMVDAAPPLISVRGQAEVLGRPAIAIVGARNASALGSRFAASLARDLAGAGLLVVSGLARGIDTAAHQASVDEGTVAVLAGGLGRLYPRENEDLARRLCEAGALVSEMPFDWTATGRDFPRRNRIVSGLSYGVVVVEAALRSGSLITARFATEQGREVFAVPGSPLDPRAEGANRLIQQGATLITGAGDVLDVLRPLLDRGAPKPPPLAEEGREPTEPLWEEWDELAAPPPSAPPQMPGHRLNGQQRLLGLIGAAPVSIDELVRQSGLNAQQVHEALVELHLAGRLERHGDSRVSLA
jgi:DNA processing protein